MTDPIYIFRPCVSDFSLYTLFVMSQTQNHGPNIE